MFSKIKEETFVSEVYAEFGLSIKKGTFKIQDQPIGLGFLGAKVHAFEYNKRIYFVPVYNRERIMSGLQISTEILSVDDEIMKAFSLLELGWYDCYDEISSYIRYLLKKAPESPVKRSFMSGGIPTRDRLRMRWAGLDSAAL